MKKRIISILLSSTLILSMLASNIAYAAPDNKTNTVSGYIETEALTEYIYETEFPEDFSEMVSEGFQETEASTSETALVEKEPETETQSALNEETEENTNNSSASIKSSAELESTAQVGDVFSDRFGKYQVLTVGDTPTAAIIDDPYVDVFGNFSHGDPNKPWTAEYKNAEYSITEIHCEILGSGTAKIPEGITYISNGAFSKCAIKNIEIPASLEHFDEDHTLHNLESITVAEDNQHYKVVDGALLTKDGTKLILYPAMLPGDSYTSPDSVLNVEEGAFYNNAYLKTIILTKVERIKDYAFYKMHNIETLKYPKTLIDLSTKYVTFNCFTLKHIFVEKGNPILYDEDGILFYKSGREYMLVVYPASYPLNVYTIPYGVKTICNFTFNGITQTERIDIPASVNTIYSYAFSETQLPIEFVLHFSSERELFQSAFDELARGSKLYVANEEIKNGFRKDFLTTRIDETGGTKIDTETPVIVDYEKAVSRIENWYVHDGKKYYYDREGNLAEGLHEISGSTYFFGKNHEMQTGFQDADGKTYYFSPENGQRLLRTGIVPIEDKKYYINSDYCIYKEPELNFDNRIYYLDTNTGEIICDSLSHSYGPWEETVAATCTDDGSHSHTCIKCSRTETLAVPKLQHQFGDWKITASPTCVSSGKKIHTCSLCQMSEEQTIPASHVPGNWTITKQPTCRSNGTKTLKCTICGESLQTASIQQTAHKYGNWKIQRQSTYDRHGSKERTCSLCGTTDQAVIPRLLRADISKVSVSAVKQKIYNAKSQRPSVRLKINGQTLKKNVDYSISYFNNKNPGKATIRLTGKGAFYGTKKVYFYIAPKAPGIRRVDSKKKAFSIQIKKASRSTGSQLFYSTHKSFKNGKYQSFSGSSKTIGKLKSKKTYYVKVRSYKKVGSKKIYGSYGSVQKVKIN
ncbi:leucine-rich repeat protein [uncultured Robinsoniella sp.]|uniref:N-acetylmuramoyl-L-alanine amidase family protein n=1 Tax=uncultured Robinsoniella sp. TaxID=904190 RepID=UPI00374F2540